MAKNDVAAILHCAMPLMAYSSQFCSAARSSITFFFCFLLESLTYLTDNLAVALIVNKSNYNILGFIFEKKVFVLCVQTASQPASQPNLALMFWI